MLGQPHRGFLFFMEQPIINIQDFSNEWSGKTIDYNHVFRTEAIDLILQFLYQCYQINVPYTSPLDFWQNTDPQVLQRFDKLSGLDILASDILILQNPMHIVIATGNQNDLAFEGLEQNGETGGGSTQAGNFVRSRYIEREHVVGSFRAKAVVPELVEPEVLPEPPVPIPYVLPSGAVPVPVMTSDLVLDVDVKAYGNKTDAAKNTHDVALVTAGNYLVFQKADNGMLYIGLSRESIKYWINPSDNVLPPAPPPEPTKFVNPRRDSVPIVVPKVVEPELIEPVVVVDWKQTYSAFNPDTGNGVVTNPRIYQVNLEGRIWNLDENGPEASVFLSKDKKVNVYGTVTKDDVKYYRLKVKRDINFDWWLCAPITFDGRAVLTLPAPSWIDKIFHKGEQLKSIFTDDEPKFIDSVLLKPFSKRRK